MREKKLEQQTKSYVGIVALGRNSMWNRSSHESLNLKSGSSRSSRGSNRRYKRKIAVCNYRSTSSGTHRGSEATVVLSETCGTALVLRVEVENVAASILAPRRPVARRGGDAE